MRIIAGTLGGRLFDSPRTDRTHPMSDKARGALFNALGDLEGLTVLDAFGGTGALSFEAISRGADRAVCIESDASAQKMIQRNIDALDLQKQVKLIRASADAWLKTSGDHVFDVVLCDPPYDDLQPKLLVRLSQVVAPGGIIVFSLPAQSDFALPGAEYQALATKSYGDMQLAFYRRIS